MSRSLCRSSEHLIGLLIGVEGGSKFDRPYLESLTRNALVHLAYDEKKIDDEELQSSLSYTTNVIKVYLWTLLDREDSRRKVREYAIECSKLQQRAFILLRSTYYNSRRHGDLEAFVRALDTKGSYERIALHEHVVDSTRDHPINPFIDRTLQESPLLRSFGDSEALRALVGLGGFDNAKKYIATKVKTNVNQHVLRHILPRVVRHLLRGCHANSDIDGVKELFYSGVTEKTVHSDDIERIASMRSIFVTKKYTPEGISLPEEPNVKMISLHLECCAAATGEDVFAPFPSCGLGRNYQRLCTRLFKFLTGEDLVEALHLTPLAWRARMKAQRRKKRRKHKKNKPGGITRIRKEHLISSIETDGVGLSIVLKAERKMPQFKIVKEEVPKKQRDEEAKRRLEEKLCRLGSLPNAKRRALDPGRVKLFVSAEENQRENPEDPASYKKITFSREKLFRMTGRLQNEEWTNRRVTENPDVASAMQALTSAGGVKCHDENAWNVYLTRRHEHRVVLEDEFVRLDDRCRLRMATFRKRQRALAHAADSLVMDCVREKVPCILGYGTGWGGGCGGKGERTVPVKAMYRAVIEAFKRHRLEGGVVDVWEFLSTQKCHRCGEKMQVLYRPSLTEHRQEERDFRCCTKCVDQQRKYRNRDFNAAINILKCLQAMLEGAPRPEYLCPLPRPKRKQEKEPRAPVQRKRKSNPVEPNTS